MKPNDSRVDRRIADALRANASDPYAGSLDRLAARIDTAVAPLLSARGEGGARVSAWWDYAAEWARALIPVSVALAAASLVFLWLMRASRMDATGASVTSSAIVATVSRGAPPELVDRAVDELVSPTAPLTRRPR